MRKCIICEKPSLANNVCRALMMMGEKVERKEGYSQTENYFVVPAFGHLFTLCDVEEYQENSAYAGKWTLENLPFFPNTYEFTLKKDLKTKKVDSGVKKQYQIIKKLVTSSETEAIIHCGDSDREGEIIVRIILDQAKNKKPVYRLWLPDQVEKTIIHGLKTMENDTKYNALADEGYARMFIDWNYGINLTRYATLKCNTLVKVGRVVSAILKIIYDREMEIRNFVPEKYFSCCSGSNKQEKDQLIELVSKHKFKFDELHKAKELCTQYNDTGAMVSDIKKEKKIIGSPKLFSQSGLQNILAKKYKYSPDKTLSLVQSLYEKGYVSYPRTPTEYLATAEKEKVKELLAALQSKKGEKVIFKDKKSIFDDSKIESHSAITPTVKLPNLDSLTQDERNCYTTIYNRFCAVFCEEDCMIHQTIMEIKVGDLETFTLKGNVSIQKGWKAYEQVEEKEKTLPNLQVGDKVMIDFKPVEKETQPKKRYTVETLNNMLKNPFRDEMKSFSGDSANALNDKDQVAPGGDKEETLSSTSGQADSSLDDTEEYKAMLNGLEIGTEATRPGIIKGAIQSEYIALTKGVYSLLPKGEYIVNALAELGIDMSKEKTVFLGKTLKDVYKGEKTIQESLAIVNQEIANVIVHGNNKQSNGGEVKQWSNARQEKEVIGKCPVCGKPIYETPKAYSCNGGRDGCGFVIWKRISSKTIAKTQAVKLLKNKKTDKLKSFISKNGKPFNARLVLKNGKVEFSFD